MFLLGVLNLKPFRARLFSARGLGLLLIYNILKKRGGCNIFMCLCSCIFLRALVYGVSQKLPELIMNRVFRKLRFGIVFGVCICMLSGCGTLANKRETTYGGVAQDVAAINSSMLWLFTFGLIPVMYIVSLPVDAAIDTLLYPYDVVRREKFNEVIPKGFEVPLYSVNLTGGQEFDYAIWDGMTWLNHDIGAVRYFEGAERNNGIGSIISSRAISMSDTDDSRNVSVGVINPVLFFSRFRTFEENNLIFRKIGPIYKDRFNYFYRDTVNIKKANVSGDKEFIEKSVIIFFMPCDEIVIVRSMSSAYEVKAVQRPDVQAVLRKRIQQAASGKCPVPSSSILVIPG